MKTPVIELEAVQVEIDGNVILRDNNFVVEENDFVGIIGPNGGGKTTLLKVILGLIAPVKGTVRVFGEPPAAVRTRIGYVPQLSSFDREFPIDVRDAVLMGRLPARGILRRYNRADRVAVDQALEKLEIAHLKNRPVGKLSGGERQRVFLARALVSQPRLLLLDEPTASIDPQMKTGVYALLEALKGELTMVMVTHDIGVISSQVNKIACLNGNLYYHEDKNLTRETLDAVYQCPVDLIAHGLPHRVLGEHHHKDCSC